MKTKNKTISKKNSKETIKIKEDAIKDFLIDDIKDQSKNLDQENWKNYIIFLILGFFINPVFNLEVNCLTIFIYIIFMFIFFLSSYNFFSKKIPIHTGIEYLFKPEKKECWDDWINEKYEKLKKNYNSYSELLKNKVFLNKINLFFLCVIMLLFTINKLITIFNI